MKTHTHTHKLKNLKKIFNASWVCQSNRGLTFSWENLEKTFLTWCPQTGWTTNGVALGVGRMFGKGEKGLPLPQGFVAFLTSTVGSLPSQCLSQSPLRWVPEAQDRKGEWTLNKYSEECQSAQANESETLWTLSFRTGNNFFPFSSSWVPQSVSEKKKRDR